jgi:hypothetical protein
MLSAQMESEIGFPLIGVSEVGPGESADHDDHDDQGSIATVL